MHVRPYLRIVALEALVLCGLAMVAIPLSNSALLDLWYWFPSHLPMWFVYPFESFILSQMFYVGIFVSSMSLSLTWLNVWRWTTR